MKHQQIWLRSKLNNPTFHQTFTTTNKDNTTEPDNTGPGSYLLLLLSESDVLYFRHKVTQLQMQLKQEKNIFKRNVILKLSCLTRHHFPRMVMASVDHHVYLGPPLFLDAQMLGLGLGLGLG